MFVKENLNRKKKLSRFFQLLSLDVKGLNLGLTEILVVHAPFITKIKKSALIKKKIAVKIITFVNENLHTKQQTNNNLDT